MRFVHGPARWDTHPQAVGGRFRVGARIAATIGLGACRVGTAVQLDNSQTHALCKARMLKLKQKKKDANGVKFVGQS